MASAATTVTSEPSEEPVMNASAGVQDGQQQQQQFSSSSEAQYGSTLPNDAAPQASQGSLNNVGVSQQSVVSDAGTTQPALHPFNKTASGSAIPATTASYEGEAALDTGLLTSTPSAAVGNEGSSSLLAGTVSRPAVTSSTSEPYRDTDNNAISEPPRRAKVEVKLFVGRLPRTMDEATLTAMFTPFGAAVETVIIRDKGTGQHKGSAFIKMASITDADAAIRALHNIKVVDPQLGPILVKYANGEPERLGLSSTDSGQPGTDLGKLFVGSLGRSLVEDDVRRMFEPFGRIEEIVLMKDPGTSQSKGCAFVKFQYKEDAINAIKAMHGIVTTPGSNRPLEVKFAESRRSAAAPGGGSTGASVLSGAPASSVHPGAATVSPGAVPGGANWTTGAVAPSNVNPRTVGGWTEYFTADSRAYYYNETTGQTQWMKPPEFDRLCAASLGPVMGRSGAPGGPPGANVFVFHIPNEWTQNDVAAHFSHFGPVISCYIATDRATGRNKGYGFVSFDNIQSAANAVLGMNGYLVGSKRLKVSIKTGEESHVAHLLGPAGALASGAAHPMAAHHHHPQHPGVQGAAMHSSHLALHHPASSHHLQGLGSAPSALGPPPTLQGGAYHPHHASLHHHHHAAHHHATGAPGVASAGAGAYGPASASNSAAALGSYRAAPY